MNIAADAPARFIPLMSQPPDFPLHPQPGNLGGWLLICFLLFAATLILHATHTALTASDAARRGDAYRVLKLLCVGVTGSGGLLTVVVHLAFGLPPGL